MDAVFTREELETSSPTGFNTAKKPALDKAKRDEAIISKSLLRMKSTRVGFLNVKFYFYFRIRDPSISRDVSLGYCDKDGDSYLRYSMTIVVIIDHIVLRE